jgi:nucleoside-diphosphate-sugar epimerase
VRPLEGLKSGLLRLPGDATGIMTPVYIDDLADGIVRALLRPEGAGGTFTCWDGAPVTAAEFFGCYARMLGRDRAPALPRAVLHLAAAAQEVAARVTGTPPVATRHAITFISRRAAYPNARAREVLGWEPTVSLEEGMRRTEAWFRSEGLLSP